MLKRIKSVLFWILVPLLMPILYLGSILIFATVAGGVLFLLMRTVFEPTPIIIAADLALTTFAVYLWRREERREVLKRYWDEFKRNR